MKAGSAFQRFEFLRKEGVIVLLLLLWGLFLFYSHLTTPVVSDEAMYAAVGRQITRTREWFHLTYEGGSFLYKPPLHFWLMALSLSVWGPTEFAVRFPSATFGLATMLLVYACGRALFQPRVGLLAALFATTTFELVWLARKGKLDVELSFWMNLALFAFYLAYRGPGRRLRYLSVSFLSMAVATMLKGPIGLILPGGGAVAYVLIARRSKALQEAPFLGAGLALFLLLTGPYFWMLGETFNRYFFVVENLQRIVEPSKPALYYFYMIFADLFPWSLFLPSVGVSLWTSRPRGRSEAERLLLLWPLTFFLLLNLPSYKEEDFLVYLIPPVAVLLAHYWDRLLRRGTEWPPAGEGCLLQFTVALLSVGTGVALFVGPGVLRRRLPGFPDFLPLPFALLLLGGCVGLLAAAHRRHLRAMFAAVVAIAMALAFGLVQFFSPALARYDTVKTIGHQVRSLVGDAPLVLSSVRGTAELLYYLDRPEPVPEVSTAGELAAAFRSERRIFGLLAQERYEELARQGDVPLVRLADYAYRKWHYVLVSNRR